MAVVPMKTEDIAMVVKRHPRIAGPDGVAHVQRFQDALFAAAEALAQACRDYVPPSEEEQAKRLAAHTAAVQEHQAALQVERQRRLPLWWESKEWDRTIACLEDAEH